MEIADKKDQKLIVLYRVVQHWRAPIFEKLASSHPGNFKVIYGPDFEGTKVVSTRSNFAFSREKVPSIKIRARTANDKILMPFSPFLFFKLIRERPKVIISEGASNLLNAFQGFIYAKLFGKKFIWWSLGKLQYSDFDNKRKRINFLINWIERGSDAIITYSTIGKKYFQHIGVDPRRIFVAVNVIDTDLSFQKMQNINKQDVYREFHRDAAFVVLYVGALDPVKRVDMLMKAFSKLHAAHGNKVVLHIVGKGESLEELQQLAATLQCPVIKFHGQVIDDVNRFFLGSDVFVLPGLGGLAVSEAMVHGLPVIASVGDGCEMDLVDETNGVIDPYLNEDSLFKYLSDLYADTVKLNSMKEASLKKIKEQYNIKEYLLNIQRAVDYVTSEKS